MIKNRKIRYTQKVIQESLLELLGKKAFSSITVKELCALADINRSTFYAHYKDIFDLVEKLEDDIADDIIQEINEENIIKENQEILFRRIFRQLYNNKEKYRLILVNRDSLKVIDRIFKVIYDYSKHLLRERYEELTDHQIEYIYGFISRGAAQYVIRWMENGMKESPEEMTIMLCDILKGNYNY